MAFFVKIRNEIGFIVYSMNPYPDVQGGRFLQGGQVGDQVNPTSFTGGDEVMAMTRIQVSMLTVVFLLFRGNVVKCTLSETL